MSRELNNCENDKVQSHSNEGTICHQVVMVMDVMWFC